MELIENLEDVLSRGAGFVVDPFNRRWHRTRCARVRAMTTGERKWYGATREEVDRFMADRLSRYATARPIDPCPACRPDGTPDPALSQPTDTDRVGCIPAQSPLRVRQTARGFVASSPERVPFEPRPNSASAHARSELRQRLRALRPGEGELLHAVLVGAIPANSDVENYLIYNVFDGPSTAALAHGVRFELDDSRPTDGFEYRYEIAASGARFRHWRQGGVAAAWSGLSLPAGPDELLLSRTWWGLHAGAVRQHSELAAEARFGVRLAVEAPVKLTAERLKRLIDGVVAAFQRHGASEEAVRRIAARLGERPSAVAAVLANPSRAPLGPAEKAVGLTRASVQWNPDDTRLVAAEVAVRLGERPTWRLAGSVFAVER